MISIYRLLQQTVVEWAVLFLRSTVMDLQEVVLCLNRTRDHQQRIQM